MSDRMSPEARSRVMSAIRGKGTAIELEMERLLDAAGLAGKYVKNDNETIGRPDFSFRGARVAVFVDGAFWHGLASPDDLHTTEKNLVQRMRRVLKSNLEPQWKAKLCRNLAMDVVHDELLRQDGWEVFRVSEAGVKGMVGELIASIVVQMEAKCASGS